MIRAILIIPALVMAAPAAHATPGKPVDIRARNSLDCTLYFTNDYVEDVIMMQDATGSPDACRAACDRYAQESLIGMREAVYVLRYTCLFRETVVAAVDLKS